MSTYLEGIAKEIERQTHEVVDLFGALDEAALRWRPRPEKWSIAEHVAHLTLSNRPYLPAIDASVAAARRGGRLGPGPYRGSWLGQRFAASLEPPPRRRTKTFKKLTPAPSLDTSAALSEFRACQGELLEVIRRAEGVDIGRAKLASPHFRLLRLRVIDALDALLAHTRRHIWLVREVQDQPGFPGGSDDEPST